jgi:hypothetical protein
MLMRGVVLLNVICAECRNYVQEAVCPYDECCYAECHNAECCGTRLEPPTFCFEVNRLNNRATKHIN